MSSCWHSGSWKGVAGMHHVGSERWRPVTRLMFEDVTARKGVFVHEVEKKIQTTEKVDHRDSYY